MSEPRAFVAGATGYTGRAVVEVLRARDLQAIAHVRPDSSRLGDARLRFKALGATLIESPWDEDQLVEQLRDVRPTLVFSLLGTTRARMAAIARAGGDPDRASYEAIDLGLTERLIRATLRGAPEARFVYLSSLGVSGRSRLPYLAVRWRAEEALKASGLAWTIARPGFITGPDREEFRLGERLAATLGDGLLNIAAVVGAGRLKSRYGSMRGKELAECLVAAGLDADCAGKTLETEALREVWARATA